MAMKTLGLLGGTFDRFHKGHRKLLETGLSECQNLEIWMTSDNLAKGKDPRIESWNDRKELIVNTLAEDVRERVSFHVLEDLYGPATIREDVQAIVCTPETADNCEKINSLRLENSLAPLHIVIAEHELDWMGRPISSTNIRRGIMDREGCPWLHKEIGLFDLILNEDVELSLKTPFGQLIEGDESDPKLAMREVLSRISDSTGPIIAVGDVTVKALQDLGRSADIALIDGMTKRQKWDGSSEIDKGLFDTVLRCSNPPGKITPELYRCCIEAISKFGYGGGEDKSQSTLIVIDGEEDLAPLIIHPLTSLGSVILYGQPGKGVVIRYTDIDAKSRCRNLLESMDGDWSKRQSGS
tara:strand:- start:1979 stop:3040 length:1062 start_codon:yes stop_codon:yes gene_type:complete